MTKLTPWNPTPPDSSLMSRQEWLNMGGDIEMDEAEERSQVDQGVPQPNEPLLKMEPDDSDET